MYVFKCSRVYYRTCYYCKLFDVNLYLTKYIIFQWYYSRDRVLDELILINDYDFVTEFKIYFSVIRDKLKRYDFNRLRASHYYFHPGGFVNDATKVTRVRYPSCHHFLIISPTVSPEPPRREVRSTRHGGSAQSWYFLFFILSLFWTTLFNYILTFPSLLPSNNASIFFQKIQKKKEREKEFHLERTIGIVISKINGSSRSDSIFGFFLRKRKWLRNRSWLFSPLVKTSL